MDHQESIKVIQAGIAWANWDKRQKEAMLLAMQALKKQMSQRPQEHYNWCDLSRDERKETSQWFCPECQSAIEENWAYCANCGQKIDW